MAEENNVIMDGRDIGTVVLPNADVKSVTVNGEKIEGLLIKEAILKEENDIVVEM